MPTFEVNMKHTPESCPLFNEQVRNKFKQVVGKRKSVAEKHQVKILSACTSVLEHLIFYVVDAPSQRSIENYFKEIGFASWNNVEIRQVQWVEDVLSKL